MCLHFLVILKVMIAALFTSLIEVCCKSLWAWTSSVRGVLLFFLFLFFCYGYILVLISWFNTSSLGKCRNVSISFRFSNIECRSWNHALILFWISLVDVVIFICSFLDLSICVFSFFSYYLGRNSDHLLYLLEDSAFRFPYFCIFFSLFN